MSKGSVLGNTRGGTRSGAVHTVNVSIYEEKGVVIRIPFFASRISAGFPSPANDFLETALDLNHYLIQHPAATFFVRTSGDSMIEAGIHNNDILVVDRSLEAKNGAIVIAVINGELTVKRLHIKGRSITLLPENPNYPPLPITEEMGFQIWGVVTSVIHEFKGFS